MADTKVVDKPLTPTTVKKRDQIWSSISGTFNKKSANSTTNGSAATVPTSPPELPPRLSTKLMRRDQLSKSFRTMPGFKKRKLTKQEARERIAFIKTYASWLDSIPGCPIPIGIDGIIGLIPGVGDVSGAGLSLLLIYLARDLDLPKDIYNKLFLNVGADVTIGAIPLIGDAFDILFKANLRNLKIIEKWFEKNLDKFEETLPAQRSIDRGHQSD